ncbi:hypothetical protein MCOR06_000057 [Pyricularia oryzae]|nr:hypothetical protein MCOR06_000057 [Pyricularia oryzae]
MSKSHGVTRQLLREPDSWIPPEPVSSDYKTRNARLHSSDDKMCALSKPSSGAFLTTACLHGEDGNKGRGVDAECRLPRHDVGVAVDASCHGCRGAGEQHLLHPAQYMYARETWPIRFPRTSATAWKMARTVPVEMHYGGPSSRSVVRGKRIWWRSNMRRTRDVLPEMWILRQAAKTSSQTSGSSASSTPFLHR